MDVSVIIVNYNTCELTLQCLHSLFDKTKGLSFEVLLVDNASTDESIFRIKQEFPQVNLIESDVNLGFGRANNLGFAHSSGDFIFLLNSDTLLINNAIMILCKFLKEHEKIAIAGGQLFENDGLKKTHSYSHLFPSILMELDILFFGLITRYIENRKLKGVQSNGFMNVSYITGADMMLRRSDILEFGFFNESFFLYFEECELSYRFYCNRKKSAFVAEAKIIHLAGGSFSLAKTRSKYYLEGRKNYYKITHSKLYHLLANVIWKFIIIKTIIRNLRYRNKRGEWINRLRLFLNCNTN